MDRLSCLSHCPVCSTQLQIGSFGIVYYVLTCTSCGLQVTIRPGSAIYEQTAAHQSELPFAEFLS